MNVQAVLVKTGGDAMIALIGSIVLAYQRTMGIDASIGGVSTKHFISETLITTSVVGTYFQFSKEF